MANDITAHTMIEGSRNLVIQYNIVADGTGNYSDYELLDVTDYTGADQKQPNNYKVVKVSGRNGVGTTFTLKFGDLGYQASLPPWAEMAPNSIMTGEADRKRNWYNWSRG